MYLSIILCFQLYDIKYSYLIQILCIEMYGSKYSHLTSITFKQLYSLKQLMHLNEGKLNKSGANVYVINTAKKI